MTLDLRISDPAVQKLADEFAEVGCTLSDTCSRDQPIISCPVLSCPGSSVLHCFPAVAKMSALASYPKRQCLLGAGFSQGLIRRSQGQLFARAASESGYIPPVLIHTAGKRLANFTTVLLAFWTD
eukprot:7674887-Pyramimonas_sp.AAC.2